MSGWLISSWWCCYRKPQTAGGTEGFIQQTAGEEMAAPSEEQRGSATLQIVSRCHVQTGACTLIPSYRKQHAVPERDMDAVTAELWYRSSGDSGKVHVRRVVFRCSLRSAESAAESTRRTAGQCAQRTQGRDWSLQGRLDCPPFFHLQTIAALVHHNHWQQSILSHYSRFPNTVMSGTLSLRAEYLITKIIICILLIKNLVVLETLE